MAVVSLWNCVHFLKVCLDPPHLHWQCLLALEYCENTVRPHQCCSFHSRSGIRLFHAVHQHHAILPSKGAPSSVLPLCSSGDPSYKGERWIGEAHGWKCDILWQRSGGIFETLVDNSGKDLLIIFALPSVGRILRLEFFKKIVLKGSPARWQNRTSVIHQRQHGQAVSLGKTKANCLSSIPN